MRRTPQLALLLALVAGVPAVAAATARADAGDARPLPFLSDDYARALGEARSRALPLFIEAWAPW